MLRSCPKKNSTNKVKSLLKSSYLVISYPGGLLPYISHMVFASFQSENGYRLCPFLSRISYGFRGNYASVFVISVPKERERKSNMRI